MEVYCLSQLPQVVAVDLSHGHPWLDDARGSPIIGNPNMYVVGKTTYVGSYYQNKW